MIRSRKLWVSMVLAGFLTASAPSAPSAAASMPLLLWRNVDRVSVLCLVASPRSPTQSRVEAMLCERTRALAAQGAPFPVEKMGFGDPAILQGRRVTLLVHAAIQANAGGSRLLFTVRPYRAGGPDADMLFGSRPRAVVLDADDRPGRALDAALADSLAEILPWKSRQLHNREEGE